MLSFGTSVSINNLFALKAFHTFLFNYQLHEKPNFLERYFLPRLNVWVEDQAMKQMASLAESPDAKDASVSLNDVSSEIFTVLYLVQHPELIIDCSTGKELFIVMAQMNLEFIKIQKPKASIEFK